MSEPVHCPYLGLRQNRAIRFAAPTPEHRCYREGTPIEIPVDQRTYCLTAQHRTCPLYTGQWDASRQGANSGQIPAKNGAKRASANDAVGTAQPTSLSSTSRRNRLIYFAVLILVGLLIVFWGSTLYRSSWWNQGTLPPGDPSPTFSLPVVVPPAIVNPTVTPSASALPRATETLTPTTTLTPTPSPSVSPTSEPTFPPIPTVTVPIFVPEPTFELPVSTPEIEQPTDDTTIPPTPTEALPTPTIESSPLPTAAPTQEVPTAEPPTEEPTTAPIATETTAPPAPEEPTATIVLQLTVLPLQRP